MDHQERVGGGGMTGATGDLTPDRRDDAFEPGERREIEDPEHRADATQAMGRIAPSQQGEIGDPGELPTGGPTNLATRDDGYGSEHGLSPDDPAYRMESNPSRTRTPAAESTSGRGPEIGGDEMSEGEDRF